MGQWQDLQKYILMCFQRDSRDTSVKWRDGRLPPSTPQEAVTTLGISSGENVKNPVYKHLSEYQALGQVVLPSEVRSALKTVGHPTPTPPWPGTLTGTPGRRPAGLGVPLSLAGGRGGVPESPPPRQEARLELGSGRDACRPLRSSGSNPSSARATPRRWTSCLGASVSPLGVSRASPGSCLEMQLLRSPRTCRIRPAGGAQQSGREQVPGVMLLRGKGWAPLLRAIDRCKKP
nr:PREDICTED: uncharacterized protein LOC103551171 [Equus przewalskii]